MVLNLIFYLRELQVITEIADNPFAVPSFKYVTLVTGKKKKNPNITNTKCLFLHSVHICSYLSAEVASQSKLQLGNGADGSGCHKFSTCPLHAAAPAASSWPDPALSFHQTLRALFQYKPQNIDELMINAGDFIYVNPTQQSEVSEGWVIGTSHQSGCRGFLPENYTERANESDTWVKHRLVVINSTGAGVSGLS